MSLSFSHPSRTRNKAALSKQGSEPHPNLTSGFKLVDLKRSAAEGIFLPLEWSGSRGWCLFSNSNRLFFSSVERFVPGFLDPFFLRGGERLGAKGGERFAVFIIFARAGLVVVVLGKAVLILGLFMLAAAVRSKELMFVRGAAAGDFKKI